MWSDADARNRKQNIELWNLFERVHARLAKVTGEAKEGGMVWVKEAYDFYNKADIEVLRPLIMQSFKDDKGIASTLNNDKFTIKSYRDVLKRDVQQFELVDPRNAEPEEAKSEKQPQASGQKGKR